MTEFEAVQQAAISCLIRGCTCSPDVIPWEEVDSPGCYYVNIRHDDWCYVMTGQDPNNN